MVSSNDMCDYNRQQMQFPHLVKPGCAKEIDLSLGRQEVNAVIFAAKLMVGMSFVITLLTAMTSRRRVMTRTS